MWNNTGVFKALKERGSDALMANEVDELISELRHNINVTKEHSSEDEYTMLQSILFVEDPIIQRMIAKVLESKGKGNIDTAEDNL